MNVRVYPAATEKRRIDGIGKEALETGRNRLLVTAAVLTLAFFGIGARLVDLSVISHEDAAIAGRATEAPSALVGRADIVDRNGVVLASSLPTASLYADPSDVLDPEQAAAKILTVFPDLDPNKLLAELRRDGRFVWIKRNLSPDQQMNVNRLGIPGLGFLPEERRVYPLGPLTAHVLGATDIDGNGVSGVESRFDGRLREGAEPLRLSLDVRVQSILRAELTAAVTEFKALGAAGVVMDVNSGEVIALVSLPDFDPNDRSVLDEEARFNRATKGVYEMGSTFKLFTAAMALDSGTVSMDGGYDATKPIQVARFTIADYHPEKRWLTVPEIIVHSSNIGAAKMAVDVGTEGQRDYLRKFGLLQPSGLELPEIGRPLVPDVWRPINTMTISYGHGVAVSPVQLASAISALANGGTLETPTILAESGDVPQRAGPRVISEETSDKVRQLMRLVVAKGTGRKAQAPGYFVGGKTGTAEKQFAGRYKKSAKISSFVGVFPIQAPRYVVFAMVDEPVGNKRTFNYATGGWVAAPVVGRVVTQIGPLLGVMPVAGTEEVLPLPLVDDERKRVAMTPKKKLMHEASVTTGTVRPASELKTQRPKAPPPAPPLPTQKTEAPPGPGPESPDDRIARKTREALEQAFAVR